MAGSAFGNAICGSAVAALRRRHGMKDDLVDDSVLAMITGALKNTEYNTMRVCDSDRRL